MPVDPVTSKNGDISTASVEAIATNNTQGIPKEFVPILSLCFLVTLLSALDRVAMSIAILPIFSEFHYTDTIQGQISAVSYGYGLARLPIGLAWGVVPSRTLMLVGVFLWSLATLGMSNTASENGVEIFLLPLLLIRAVMGAAEALVLPTMQRILANWVPPEKKVTVLAIYFRISIEYRGSIFCKSFGFGLYEWIIWWSGRYPWMEGNVLCVWYVGVDLNGALVDGR